MTDHIIDPGDMVAGGQRELFLSAPEAIQHMKDHPGEFLYWYKGRRVHFIEKCYKHAHCYPLHDDPSREYPFVSLGEYELIMAEPITPDELRRRCHVAIDQLTEDELLSAYDHLQREYEFNREDGA